MESTEVSLRIHRALRVFSLAGHGHLCFNTEGLKTGVLGGLEKPLANSFLVKGHQIVINQAISLKFLDDFKGGGKNPKPNP